MKLEPIRFFFFFFLIIIVQHKVYFLLLSENVQYFGGESFSIFEEACFRNVFF